ncbi:hypothetical protein DV736_g2241, partial [Chaetothyriales sp. CBS 134916]
MDYASFPPSYTTTSTWRVSRERTPRTKTRRKGTKARTWSEAEEQYLIQSRRHRIQYKSIAARLQKSELACRLHYHQLTKLQQPTEAEAHGSKDYYNSGSGGRIISSTPSSTNVAMISPAVDARQSPLKLPSLTAMIDEHQPNIPLYGNLQVPLPSQWEQQPCPPGYILPPPRGLWSPFDEARVSHHPGDGLRSHVPAISQRWNRGNPQRSASMGSLVEILPLPPSSVNTSSPTPSYMATPNPAPSPMISSSDRCSVHSLLDQRDD